MPVVAAQVSALASAALATNAAGADVAERVEHKFAQSGDVRIHYAALGEGPLVVMIHGFPDYWYTWRHAMQALADRYRVAAVDLRGYNRSDKPQGIERYAMSELISDVEAVIGQEGRERAIVVGHDWGGAIAWQVALQRPERVERLVILNLPHPTGMRRELERSPAQREDAGYARTFQDKSADDPTVLFGGPMTAERLAGWVRDPAARARYVEAFKRSDFEAMLSYYKASYPRPEAQPGPPPPRAHMPVLMFHGLDDRALHAGALNDTWQWLEKDLTLVTIPNAGHFVQADAPELVTETLLWWLGRRAQSPEPPPASAARR